MSSSTRPPSTGLLLTPTMWCLALATEFAAGQATDFSVIGRDELVRTLPLDVMGNAPSLEESLDAELEANLRRSIAEHESEAAETCRNFYCGPSRAGDAPVAGRDGYDSYPIGPVPSVDFPAAFAGEDGRIFVSKAPLFSAAECDRVVALAELEGEGLPSTPSGKYKLGKAWIKDMPKVNEWFNEALSTKLFPSLAALFPSLLVSGAASLRAHSVAILKYNASHPRTDVHVDDALLAFTIALSPPSSFVGGGTYFESLDAVVEMAQGHATFRPGSIRHGGHAVESGVRYVLGGFIAVADRVEHVRRLNERGNRLMLASPGDEAAMLRAERLFRWGVMLNPNCSLCFQNLGDTYLRLEQPAAAEAELTKQIRLLPRDSDAYFGLGNALRSQERPSEARAAYEAAVAITPTDFESHLGLASTLGAMEEFQLEVASYRNALELRPSDAMTWINLGIGLSFYEADEAEAAFRRAVELAPTDTRTVGLAPLNLGRYLAKLSRPAEAIGAFYQAAAADAEYFEEMKLGVGTARAQQGRLREALEHFQSASRMKPSNAALRESLVEMESKAALVEALAAAHPNAVAELCGTPCQDVVDAAGVTVCGITWADGCGEGVAPPEGFNAASTVVELCSSACAFHTLQLREAEEQRKASTGSST